MPKPITNSRIPFTAARTIVPAFHQLACPTRLLLFRHGAVQARHQGRLYGQRDVALSALGRRQSERAARKIAGMDVHAVYSSDLRRSVHLAELIANRRGLQLETRTAFRERHFGLWQDCNWGEIAARWPALHREYLADFLRARIPGAENFRQVRRRVLAELESILRRHAGETIALVAHAGPNRVILADALGLRLNYLFNIWNDYGALNEIEYYAQGSALVKKINA